MSIQSTINQGLSLAGLLLSQSPVAERSRDAARLAGEKKTATQNIESAEKIADTAFEELEKTIESVEKKKIPEAQKDISIIQSAEYQTWKEAWKAEDAAHAHLTKIDPTEKNIKSMINRRRLFSEQLEMEERANEALAADRARLEKSNRIKNLILNPGGK